jgi:hypothetical protein
VRALLIDAERQAITEIDFHGTPTEIQDAIGCQRYRDDVQGYANPATKPLTGSVHAGYDTLYVDDDQLEAELDPRFWFQIDANEEPPSSPPIAGRGLVVGVNRNGGHCDACISIEMLKARVQFTRRRFEGYREVYAGPDLLRIDLIVPLIQ